MRYPDTVHCRDVRLGLPDVDLRRAAAAFLQDRPQILMLHTAHDDVMAVCCPSCTCVAFTVRQILIAFEIRDREDGEPPVDHSTRHSTRYSTRHSTLLRAAAVVFIHLSILIVKPARANIQTGREVVLARRCRKTSGETKKLCQKAYRGSLNLNSCTII